MSPETRDFLATVRRAEDPSAGDERRVLAALQAAITAGLTSAAAGSAPAAKGNVAVASSGLKTIGALIGVSVGAALVAVAVAVSSGPAGPRVASRPKSAHSSEGLVGGGAPAPGVTPPKSAASASPRATPPNAARVSMPATPGTAAANSASLREEIALLTSVQAELERGDGVAALRRLDEHTTSDRQFVAERRAARIAALCQLGRVAEAQRLAAVFFRENAHSVQRTAVERSCAANKGNPDR
jgi:hypothetical protein